MKRFGLIVLFSLAISQIWAEGAAERSSNTIHPGAKMILEANGYRFDSNNNLIGYRNFSITRFPYEDETNTNPHAYERNIIYITDFDANQWMETSIFATTGSASARSIATGYTNRMMGVWGEIATQNKHGTRIFISDIPNSYLRGIDAFVRNSFLIYTGVQTFHMADGSSQVFPVFQLFDLFDNTVSQATIAFNRAFDEGIYNQEDGYQYSRVNGRTFGRDIATKRELLEWNGNQWITLIGR